MDSRRGLTAAFTIFGLLLCGVAGEIAWRYGLWGLLTGIVLMAAWIGVMPWWTAARPAPPPLPQAEATSSIGDAVVMRALLDAAPTPLMAIERSGARALNRAARRLFSTDDRILPLPAELENPDATYLRLEGRSWRIHRVEVTGARTGYLVAALVDIQQEERAAEARAAAELIHVLGHELLNGLAPIVSLAESGLTAVHARDPDPALLAEILGTLARRADGLQRFTLAYRELARLPEPMLRPVRLRKLADDLARLFAVRWPKVRLMVDVPDEAQWPLDRDQMSQALWALLQNAAEAALDGQQGAATVVLDMRSAGTGLVIEVRDNGRGVPTDAAVRIFRPFHTTKPEGTGIGLSLARQIACAHGGDLVLEPARETTFRLLLPNR